VDPDTGRCDCGHAPVAHRRNGPCEVLISLDDIYAQVPDVGCRGKCQKSCNNIAMSGVERAQVAAAGYTIPAPIPIALRSTGNQIGGPCPALTIFGTCAVYSVRPGVCRLWGAVESLRCWYGCQPEGGFMSEARGMAVLEQLNAFDAGRPITPNDAYAMFALIDTPAVRPHWMAMQATMSNPHSATLRADAQEQFTEALTRARRRQARQRSTP
jgi:hypothetical protein